MVTNDNLTTKWNGISNDTRPLEHVRNGSRFREMDTSRTLMFDEENTEWLIFQSGTPYDVDTVGYGAVGYMVLNN